MSKELEQLSVVYSPGAIAQPSSHGASSPEPEDAGIPLSHYFWIIRRQAWKTTAFVLSCLFVTLLVSLRLQPIYESTATVNIDRQAPTGLVGADSEKSAGAGGGDADNYIATQVSLIQSDAVLRPVAIKYDLLEREHQFKGLDPARINSRKEAPTLLRQLNVKRLPNTYLVLIAYRSPSPQLAADVANSIAHSYIEHAYKIQIDSSTSAAGFMGKQLDDLKAKMERSGQALAQFERELNVINPEEKTSMISSRLLQLNAEYTNAQADRVKKEAMFNAMKAGSLAAEQISGQGADLVKLQEHLNAAQEAFAQIKSSKGPNHPAYKSAESQLLEIQSQYDATRKEIAHRIETDFMQSGNREQMLHDAVTQTKVEFDNLNLRSFDYRRLKDDADADKKLYQELITKIQEGGVNAGFQNRNIVIADSALPGFRPVFPILWLNLLLAFVLSSLLGIGGVILLDRLDTTIRDPELIRRLYHSDMIGSLPLVKDPKALALSANAGNKSGIVPFVPDGNGSAPSSSQRSLSSFEEAVRMVRNSILLGDFDRNLRSLLFTSATPGEGKTTAALHLAIAHAEQGKKTLLIDADLRRPTLHKRLGMSPQIGLSTALLGEGSWQNSTIQLTDVPNLHFLPAGPTSRHAADLVGPGISDILEEASRTYDLVLIDAPPVLGFAEPMQIAIAVDGVVVVAVAGETNRKAVGAVISTLRRVKANVLGVILNRTSKQAGSHYYYYDYYGYGRYNYYGSEKDKG